MGLNKVPSRVIQKRAFFLRELSHQKRNAFYRSAIGKTVEVLFEVPCASGLFSGLTGNYIRVEVKSHDNLSGQLLPVLITDVQDGMAMGVLS
jgi:tRNA A37 methylthiotransferase MiaB